MQIVKSNLAVAHRTMLHHIHMANPTGGSNDMLIFYSGVYHPGSRSDLHGHDEGMTKENTNADLMLATFHLSHPNRQTGKAQCQLTVLQTNLYSDT